MIQYQGIGAVVVTAKHENVKVGEAVQYSASDTVKVPAAGGAFHGVCVFEKNGEASVQVGGFVTLPYTGTAPTVGYCTLAANGTGGAAVTAGSRSYLTVAVDTSEKTVTFCL